MKRLSLIAASLILFCCSHTSLAQGNGAFYQNNMVFLPDGSGVNYESVITISGFPGVNILSPSDMAMVCVSIEHSYLGDIEMWLECPNGSQVELLNSYDPGILPGGISGGGTYLGDPIDDSGGGGPGEGWEYCFSSVFNTWGDYPTELAANNTIPAPVYGNSGPSLNPNGVYLPETSFSNLVGCPVDGDWRIRVRDNLAIDDGWIFGWGMNVSPSLLGHSGFVFKDFNQDCVVDNFEGGLENLTVTINPGNYVVQTNNVGGWYIDNLPVGAYTVMVDTTTSWVPTCSPTTTFTVVDPNVFVQSTPIGMVNENPCSEPNVSVFTGPIRPCMSSDIIVHVQNEATATNAISNAQVEVQLDTLLTISSASHPYTALGNNVFQFDIGDLFPNQAEVITIDALTDCQALIGQMACNQANLLPVDSCALDTIPANTQFFDSVPGMPVPCTLPWDQSTLSVNGWCQNDTIYFEVTNDGLPGTGDMQCYMPVLVFNGINLVYTDSVLLQGGQSEVYTFSGNGQMWLINVAQHPLHPGNSNPSTFVELCGDTTNWVPGLANLFPMDDSDPFVDIDCIPVSSSFDPNDKRGYPIGFTNEHYISRGDQLEYVIRFQNTGTDTAFTVVIRDTLDPQLDLFSVNVGAASHPYTFTIQNQHVLEWTFDNILLPDSTTNEPESHGFVTFSVNQLPNLPYGSIIRNEADIYFDFNAPITTNETWHTLYAGFLSVLNTEELEEQGSLISAYPNPASSVLNLEVPTELIGEDYAISDGMGRLIDTGVIQSEKTTLNLEKLSPGYYVIRLGQRSTNAIKLLKK